MGFPSVIEYSGLKKDFYLNKGKYIFKLWGAQGAAPSCSTGGKGGYIEGLIWVFRKTHVFAYVGGMGNLDSANCVAGINQKLIPGGFNGGGKVWSSFYSGSGGGASDIRFDEDLLSRRVIVAGGGGGASFDSHGGHGGYPNGTQGTTDLKETTIHAYSLGLAGNQEGSEGHTNCSLSYCIENANIFVEGGFSNSVGVFGEGGNGLGRHCAGGGGGGGWFGGSGNYNAGGGGGGSSYYRSDFMFVKHQTGIREGNGRIEIVYAGDITCKTKTKLFSISSLLYHILIQS
jgi:hypothetical protein